MTRRALAAFAASLALMLAGQAAVAGRRYALAAVLSLASLAGLAVAGCLAVAAVRRVRRRLRPPAAAVRYRPARQLPAAGPVHEPAPPALPDPCACGLPAVAEVAGRPLCPACAAAGPEAAAVLRGLTAPPAAGPDGRPLGSDVADMSEFEEDWQ